MDINENYNKALERILALNWEGDYERIGSQTLLFKEYCRRMRIWVKAINSDSLGLWPFFDVINYVTNRKEIWDEELDKRLESIPIAFYYNRKILKWYIRWEAYKGTEVLQHYSHLPEPYEPMVMIYERGGAITCKQNGIVDILSTGVNCKPWFFDLDEPFVELKNINALEAADQEYNKNRNW